MELIELHKGDKKCIVEKGSQGEREMKAVGFTEKAEPSPEKGKK